MANGILLAYSYDDRDELAKVPEELKTLENYLKATGCWVQPETRVSQTMLTNRFVRLGNQILVFHFAGHAKPDGIQLNTESSTEMEFLNLQHFGSLIAENCKGLKLIFLNGCATQQQAEYLFAQGIPAVIAATVKVNDAFAAKFATKFYTAFIEHEKPLKAAFEQAMAQTRASSNDHLFDHKGEIKEKYLDTKTRDSLGLSEIGPDDPCYRLTGNPQTLEERFADWRKDGPSPEKQVDLDANLEIPLIEHPDSYLLCDRETEEEVFREHLKLRRKTKSEPLFLLLSADYRHCPYDLIKRYQTFTLRKHENLPFKVEKLNFPHPNDFDLPTDPDKPKQKLKEIYGALNKDFSDAKKEQLPKDYLLAVVHKLPANPWREGIPGLFEYYIGSFYQEIQSNLCEHLMVICYLSYESADPQKWETAQKYIDLFQALQQKYVPRVQHLGSFNEVLEYDIEQWYLRIFDDDLNPEEHRLIPSMYFDRAKEIMLKIIDHEQTKKKEKG